jgi:hypothetical protein
MRWNMHTGFEEFAAVTVNSSGTQCRAVWRKLTDFRINIWPPSSRLRVSQTRNYVNHRVSFIYRTTRRYGPQVRSIQMHFNSCNWICNRMKLVGDRLCGLVVRVLGYRSGGPGSIPGTTRIKKKKVVGLERGPLSLVSTTEELFDRKVAAPV